MGGAFSQSVEKILTFSVSSSGDRRLGWYVAMYSGTALIRTLSNKHTSIKTTVVAGPNGTLVYYLTPEIRTHP